MWFPFTLQLLIGPGEVYNNFGGGYHQPSKKNHHQEKICPKIKIKNVGRLKTPPLPTQVRLEASSRDEAKNKIQKKLLFLTDRQRLEANRLCSQFIKIVS